MYNSQTEGIDHINAYSKSKTKLGLMLSNFYHSQFVIDNGMFESIEGYWYWLSVPEDEPRRNELKSAYGFRAKELGRELRGADWTETPEFKEKILIACSSKIIFNEELKQLLKINKLPIVHYYEYGGKTIEPEQGKWIWQFYMNMSERIRNEKLTIKSFEKEYSYLSQDPLDDLPWK